MMVTPVGLFLSMVSFPPLVIVKASWVNNFLLHVRV